MKWPYAIPAKINYYFIIYVSYGLFYPVEHSIRKEIFSRENNSCAAMAAWKQMIKKRLEFGDMET